MSGGNRLRMTSENQPLLTGDLPPVEQKKPFADLAIDVIKNVAGSKSYLVIQLGLLGTVATVFYSLFTHDVILFTGHPIFNLLGLFILGNGIALVQPAPLSAAHKTVAGALHGVLNLISTLLFVTGFSVIFYNKHIHNAAHITSWHAFFGIISYVLLVVIMLFGAAIYWLPETLFGSVNKAKSFYKYHRLAGFIALLLISLTILLAIPSDYNQNVLHINQYTLALSLLLVVGAIYTQIKAAKVRFW